MTAIAPPPPPAPPDHRGRPSNATGEAPASGASRGSTRDARPLVRSHLLLAEIALAGLTLSAVVGLCRIFASWGFLAPLLVVAGAAHLTVAACRRRGVGLAASFVATALVWVLSASWLFFLDTTLLLIPTTDTWSAASHELDRSWSAFQQIVAPAPVQTGFLLAAAAAVGLAAFLADWAAFRLWSAREALVPSITLFVFGSLLADGRYRLACAVLEMATVIAFLLVHRVVALERAEGWVGAGRARAGRSLLRSGVVVAAIAVVVGVLVAPRLPGVDEQPLVDWRREGSGTNARVVTSPLVDIRKRLVDTSDTPLFTVDAASPSYWRIAALDRFDGTQWRLSASTDQLAAGPLRVDPELFVNGGTRLNQRFTIQQLETSWLPAAYVATAFRPLDDSVVRYDAETSTFIGDEATGAGVSYEVTSILPGFSPEELRQADTTIPAWIEPSVELPADFSPTAARIAKEEVRKVGAVSRYEQALALQEFFRESGGFRYSTDLTGVGEGNDAIEQFLQDRIGYCEQFAGTFAAMARSLGIPARVAVGYTWGQADPTTPGRFQVLGRNAHAWPEVYLGQYGWVPFEPTPGRGNPDAQGYTGVPADQESDPSATTTTSTTTAPSSTTSPSTTLPGEQAARSSGSGRTTAGELLGPAARGLVIVLVAAALYLLTVPGAQAVLRRRRRRRAAGAPAAEVGVAWAEATEALAATGVRVRPDETHSELAERGRGAVPAAGPALERLAGAADAAAYGPDVTPSDAERAQAASVDVARAVDDVLGPRGRLRRLLDPRPLWQGRTRRHRTG